MPKIQTLNINLENYNNLVNGSQPQEQWAHLQLVAAEKGPNTFD